MQKPIFQPEPPALSHWPVVAFVVLLCVLFEGVNSVRASAKSTVQVASTHIPGVHASIQFTPAEQAKITSCRQLLEELAFRHYLPYEVANGLAARNEASGSAQIYLTGWSNGQPILQSYDQQYHSNL